VGSPAEFATKHGIAIRNVYNRRRSIENKLGISLPTFAFIQNPLNVFLEFTTLIIMD
jgi:hypothetical protein